MISKKINIVFKYDKYHNLCNYVERNITGDLLALYTYNYKNQSMIRFDRENQIRIFTQYDEPCKLVQKYDSGESWIKIVPFENNINEYQNPKIKKQFALNNENQIVRFSFQQYLIQDF